VVRLKKLSVILDETTILNFPFLWLLLRRYRYISLGIPLLGVVLAFYFYFTQNLISTLSIGFRSVSNDSSSPNNALSKVLGETNDTLSPQEIVEMAKSLDFLHVVAAALVRHPGYPKLNLNSFEAKRLLSTKELFSECRDDQKCQIEEVSKILPDLISIRQHNLVKNKFYVDVKALDSFTSHLLLNIASDVIVASRIENMRHQFSEQRKMTNELIEKKSEELKSTNFAGLSAENKVITAKLEGLEQGLLSMSAMYQSKQFEVNRMEITLQQTERTIQGGKSENDRERFNQQESLKNKIKQMAQDIHALEMNKESLGPSDRVVLEQLTFDLKVKKEQLKKLPAEKRSVINADKFVEEKDKAANFTFFDYMVAKKELMNLKAKSELMAAEKNELVSKKHELEQKLEQMRPVLEYFKLLEAKLVQIEMLESTIVSDLVFDQLPSGEIYFKRAEKEKIGLFSLLLSLFVMFVVLIVRYLLDSRVFNEIELERNFEGLEVLGIVPEFDK